jgi:hypothetical protein
MGRWELAGVVAATGLAVTALVACSSGDDGGADGGTGGEEATVTDRPEGPAARFGAPLEGGGGVWITTPGGEPDLDAAGYTEAEYAASGSATSYTSSGSLPTDGTFALTPGEEADYATRVVVRRPADPARFNGTVVVEWLNVSSGADVAPDYTYLAPELIRGGYTWVGVSAQQIGIEGGDVAVVVPEAEELGMGQGLKVLDPERYGDLHHPGDAFAYDIYTQVARAVRTPSGDDHPLKGLDVEQVLAIGESQSAYALTTYANGVQPLTRAFDGFLIHSRGRAAAPLGEPGAGIDLPSVIANPATTIRTDTDVPVIVVETETDVLGILDYLPARQPDSDKFRLWEIAGTAHADAFQVGDNEHRLGCTQPINRGQQVYVVRAALRHLDTWARGGAAPPGAPRLEVDETGPTTAFVLDDSGNVRGGVRSPAVDVPVDRLSGMPVEGSSVLCLLMGSTTPLDPIRLTELYTSADDYLTRYEAATDAMIDAGFALPEDRDALLDGADPTRLAR